MEKDGTRGADSWIQMLSNIKTNLMNQVAKDRG